MKIPVTTIFRIHKVRVKSPGYVPYTQHYVNLAQNTNAKLYVTLPSLAILNLRQFTG